MLPPLVPIGRISRAHGIKGEVLLKTFSYPSPTVEKAEILYLPGPKPFPLKIVSRRIVPHGYLIFFDGVDSREKAEELKGQELSCHPEDMPGLEDDEYYGYQLIGLKVCTSTEEIGVVKEVISPSGQDLLVVQGGEREYLIPAVPEIIVDVDLDDGIVSIDPPQGLLETCSTKLSQSSKNCSPVHSHSALSEEQSNKS
ncbi:MAG: 16S rRNA processing protein RimM [Deltaproteobacteria bacterium RIFCSPHIGHO2_12_FULL_43_9]|nr:MAG: 16S rRNA processing protein RimM [Deltaproteobacteria bacterium RIFCSPHIGHO2_12_FULL_43_9]